MACSFLPSLANQLEFWNLSLLLPAPEANAICQASAARVPPVAPNARAMSRFSSPAVALKAASKMATRAAAFGGDGLAKAPIRSLLNDALSEAVTAIACRKR
jgi:hypothetical protein